MFKAKQNIGFKLKVTTHTNGQKNNKTYSFKSNKELIINSKLVIIKHKIYAFSV